MTRNGSSTAAGATDRRLTRRQALARLGLGATAAYMAPAMVGLSQARASSSSKASSASSPASQASPHSAPSGPTGQNKASAPSGPDNSANEGASGPSSVSRPSVPHGDCHIPAGADHLTISRRDYQRAQAAIRRGEARPLGEIVKLTRQSHPGQPVSVGFSTSGPEPIYQIQIVTGSGSVLSLTVAARSGRILNVRTC